HIMNVRRKDCDICPYSAQLPCVGVVGLFISHRGLSKPFPVLSSCVARSIIVTLASVCGRRP
ncbi:TPA: hypothetical protein ACG0LT_005091, partial [Escherichia coli]